MNTIWMLPITWLDLARDAYRNGSLEVGSVLTTERRTWIVTAIYPTPGLSRRVSATVENHAGVRTCGIVGVNND